MMRFRLLLACVPLAWTGGCARAPRGPVPFAPAPAEKPAVRMMRSDLRNLATAQGAFYGDHKAYVERVADFPFEFSPSGPVTLRIVAAGPAGWAAVATHKALPGVECRAVVGDPPPAAGLRARDDGTCVRRR